MGFFFLGIRTSSAAAVGRGRLAGAQEVWTIVVHLGVYLFIFFAESAAQYFGSWVVDLMM